VYAKYPSLLAEMYAYSMAAAHTDLPHFTMHNLMVSNVHAGDEGWKWIDALGDNVCEAPVNGVFYPGTFRSVPVVLACVVNVIQTESMSLHRNHYFLLSKP
jgi:hypothetical protein